MPRPNHGAAAETSPIIEYSRVSNLRAVTRSTHSGRMKSRQCRPDRAIRSQDIPVSREVPMPGTSNDCYRPTSRQGFSGQPERIIVEIGIVRS